jgi:3-hydroxyacyl-CoA dehydrogenase
MPEKHTAVIIGAGSMGHGLAVQFLRSGQDVTLVDHRESNLQDAKSDIKRAITLLRDEGLTEMTPGEAVAGIEFTLDEREAVSDADIVLETISENLDAKHDLFDRIGDATPEDAVLATNTSGLRISDIANGVPDHASRVVGCHWWNPPYLMPLVEIVRGRDSSEETVQQCRTFVEAVDRDPVVVDKDVPGFVWNRIQFAVLRECMHLVEEGVASMEDVNRAVRDGYARRTSVVGPFETVDLSGLPLFQTIASDLYPNLCVDAVPSHLFDEYVSAGRTGGSSGAGFFEYERTPDERVAARDRDLASVQRAFRNRANRL